MFNEPDDLKTRELLEKTLQQARNDAREERNWKIVLPELVAFAGMYTWMDSIYPQALTVTATGLGYFLVVYCFLAAIRVGLGYPVIYTTAYLSVMRGKPISVNASIMISAIESWLMWPVAFVIVAAISPSNASYASAVTLFSGALALGIFKGILRFIFSPAVVEE